MPISDTDPYLTGHFKRVYEYIIKPACLNAGFQPLRADDVLNTNYIALDIIKQIINSDMAICDLSSRNPNVLYELGIRQSFNLPVTLIRDTRTNRIFDVQGFRDIEYDEHLRIDNVECCTAILSETIKNTYETKGQEINSLVSLLGIHAAKVAQNVEISKDTELILNSISNINSRISQIESAFSAKESLALMPSEPSGVWKELSAEEQNELTPGDTIEHFKFGKGNVIRVYGSPVNRIADIYFAAGHQKSIMLNFTKFKQLVKDQEK